MQNQNEPELRIPGIDKIRLSEILCNFTAYVNEKEKGIDNTYDGLLRFYDEKECDAGEKHHKKSFLIEEEGFKTDLFKKAQDLLKTEEWTEKWIGTGEIGKRIISVVKLSKNNLIDRHNKPVFERIFNSDDKSILYDAEDALYSIYKGNDPKEAFSKAKSIFHGYDIVAFLFFIKNYNLFLPLHPRTMGEVFKNAFGLEYKMEFRCSWENYCGYIDIIKQIQDVMNDILPLKNKARLIDAQSFVWMLISYPEILNTQKDEKDKKTKKAKERSYKSKRSGEKITVNNVEYYRDPEVVRIAKERAEGKCQLCGQLGPFIDEDGEIFLEVHHVVWLSNGGDDSTDNAVALCPNCHRKMHILNRPQDVAVLNNILKAYKE